MQSSRSFRTPARLDAWLAAYHATRRELWVRVFKKGSGTPSVAWDDCVVAAITWGWIDGRRESLDGVSFLQRLTPRRPRSRWSRRNRDHADQLIAEGRMRPPGLAHVEAARADGRWARAYAGSAGMVLPGDLLEAVRRSRAATQALEKLDRRNVYAIYLRVQAAGHADARTKCIADVLTRLTRGASFAPALVRRRNAAGAVRA